jgi:multicomponent Na+:H+ antiporter subunit E
MIGGEMAAETRSFVVGAIASAAGIRRFVFYFGFWIILIGVSPVNLIVGLPAAAAAVWVSLQLLPPGGGGPSYGALSGILLRLPWQSLVAGIDVARRAFDPRMPLRTGFVAFPSQLPPGPARDAFRVLMSLQPGTLPVSAKEEGDILFHCLDTSQPVAEQLAAEEARYLRALGQEPRNA